jgi:hypothetical protein
VVAVLPVFIPRGGAGEAKVRAIGLQHPVRVYRWRLEDLHLSAAHVPHGVPRGASQGKL